MLAREKEKFLKSNLLPLVSSTLMTISHFHFTNGEHRAKLKQMRSYAKDALSLYPLVPSLDIGRNGNRAIPTGTHRPPIHLYPFDSNLTGDTGGDGMNFVPKLGDMLGTGITFSPSSLAPTHPHYCIYINIYNFLVKY